MSGVETRRQSLRSSQIRQLVRRVASEVPYWVPHVAQMRRSSREYKMLSSAVVVIVLLLGGGGYVGK